MYFYPPILSLRGKGTGRGGHNVSETIVICQNLTFGCYLGVLM